ncbi:hypothetical protein PHLGIDRAFT_109308 [Phlebiopsis gigantea 11061_1 CR5-6]|uniref:Cytochrome P450 n=1 Tax=Phlebiopsis gigantea (strain 11061_1 CR5-6) TaxID=745531 RepID=A0A0C3RUG9_PHLG1|nr:hypothetical protein PHLGIDRAFT_109308 [Phlebiopsis gigantea 11061_1 CR5-6]
MLEEGYVKYGGKPYKIATARYWQYMVTSPKLIDELRRAPDGALSFHEAVVESLNLRFSTGLRDVDNQYHIPVIRTTLTRNLSVLADDIFDEIRAAFTDVIPPKDDWVAAPALDSMMQVVARTSSRIFVGLPLCKDPEFLEMSINYTIDVVKTGLLLNVAPDLLKPALNSMITTVPRAVNKAERLLAPLIEERRKCMEMYGDDWADKPNDMLQWLMDAVRDEPIEEQTNRALATRVLLVGFAAVHTSSMSFTHALYYLAANPQYMEPMREEVEAVIAHDGWCKASLQKMRKVDSFLKECQRVEGLGLLFLNRKALQDFTFSDGTFVPRGSFVCTATPMTHLEGVYYDNPWEFDPWRFSSMRDESGGGVRHQMVNTSTEYLPFGLGKHACPGRFFAANELKSMMAHMVLTYDVSCEEPGKMPQSVRYSTTVSPNRKAKVLFRRRRD